MVVFLIFLVAALCFGVVMTSKTVGLIKTPMVGVNYKSFLMRQGTFALSFALLFTAAMTSIYSWNNLSPSPLQVVQGVGGSFVFFLSLIVCLNIFILHYYGKNIPQKLDKALFKILIASFVATLIFFFIATNGYAEFLTYPLVNGLSFNPFKFVSPGHGKANLAWYAVVILTGALVVYFICDHEYYKEYGKHGILESVLLVAFPAGIIGARIFYVIGNFNVPSSNGGFDGIFDARVFKIWEGGLTILGGALMGIVVGVGWFLWRKKEYSIWVALDIIVPSILLAQGIGRWGNFFNCEVHGGVSNVENWKWLPEIIWRNAQYSSECPSLIGTDTLYVPLFFIESVVNILGFFVISHVCGKKFRKYFEFGDLACLYLVWYGLTRAFMEPLRDASFNMGVSGSGSATGYWSWIWAFAFVVGGVLLICANHLVRLLIAKKKDQYKPGKNAVINNTIGISVVLVATTISIVIGIILISNSEFVPAIAYNDFNIGILLLTLGLSFLLLVSFLIPQLIEGLKFKHNNVIEKSVTNE